MSFQINIKNWHLFLFGVLVVTVIAAGVVLGGTGTTPINPGHPLSQAWIDTDLNMSSYNIYTTTGKVGIGTTNPAAKLDVNGTLSITDKNEGYNTGLIMPSADMQVGGGADGSFAIRHTGLGGSTIHFGRQDSSSSWPWSMTINVTSRNVIVENSLTLVPTVIPAVTCNAASEGAIYYKNTIKRICYCDGVIWRRVSDDAPC